MEPFGQVYNSNVMNSQDGTNRMVEVVLEICAKSPQIKKKTRRKHSRRKCFCTDGIFLTLTLFYLPLFCIY